jgi:hypothetical protein
MLSCYTLLGIQTIIQTLVLSPPALAEGDSPSTRFAVGDSTLVWDFVGPEDVAISEGLTILGGPGLLVFALVLAHGIIIQTLVFLPASPVGRSPFTLVHHS